MSDGATLWWAIHVPNATEDTDPEMVASEFVDMLNEERRRNAGPSGRLTVCLFPPCEWITPFSEVDEYPLAGFAALMEQRTMELRYGQMEITNPARARKLLRETVTFAVAALERLSDESETE